MGLIQELATEISGYAKEYIKLEIVDFQPFPRWGGKWDENDEGFFRVNVSNNGELDVKDVKLHLNALGRHGKIRYIPFFGVPTNWVRHLNYDKMNAMVWHVRAKKSAQMIGNFNYRAEKHTDGIVKNLVEVHVDDYDLSWDSLLYDETDHSWATIARVAEQIYER